MSAMTYNKWLGAKDLVWLTDVIKSPPFSKAARMEAGYLLRLLQDGHRLSMPASRPMPSIGGQCHELRIQDEQVSWRLVYRVDTDAIVIADVFTKTTATTSGTAIARAQARLARYDRDQKRG